jgi:hypothetical protein
VNLDERKIDLEPLEELPGGRGAAPSQPRREKGRDGGADRGRKGRGGGRQGPRGKRGR